MRGETRCPWRIRACLQYFNPLPSCEGRLGRVRRPVAGRAISIHSPHARGDARALPLPRHFWISIHSPHARGDIWAISISRKSSIFQSTPLTRGETKEVRPCLATQRYFNPLPSREGRPARLVTPCVIVVFQSTPLMRGETRRGGWTARSSKFQSTPLTRGETFIGCEGICSDKFQSTPLMRGET